MAVSKLTKPKYDSLDGQMQIHLAWTTRKFHVPWKGGWKVSGACTILQDALMLALGGFIPFLYLGLLV